MTSPITFRTIDKNDHRAGHTPDECRGLTPVKFLSPQRSIRILLAAMALWLPFVNAHPTVSGNVIVVPDDGWYQVQDASDYCSVCEGGNSCTVEPGELRADVYSSKQAEFSDRFLKMMAG